MLSHGEIFSRLFDIGLDILASTLDLKTGTLTAQFGDVTKGTADSDSAEMWFGAPGLAARPALPTQGAASCQVLCLKRSDHDIGFAYRDLRASSIYGNLAPGEGCLYATSGQARLFVKADGSVRMMTTDDNTVTGNTGWFGISPVTQGADGLPHKGGELRYYFPWGGAWHDSSGYHLRTWHGVKVDAGGLVLPSPIGAKASTYSIKSDAIFLRCQSAVIGTAARAEPLVKALSLQALMGTFAGEVSSFAGACDILMIALSTYVLAIKSIADPTNVATPIVTTAMGTFIAAANAFASSTAATMATLRVVAGASAVAGS